MGDKSEASLTESAVIFLMTVDGMVESPDQNGLLNSRLHHVSALKSRLRTV